MIRMKIFQLLTSSFVFLFALITQVYACELTSSNLKNGLIHIIEPIALRGLDCVKCFATLVP